MKEEIVLKKLNKYRMLGILDYDVRIESDSSLYDLNFEVNTGDTLDLREFGGYIGNIELNIRDGSKDLDIVLPYCRGTIFITGRNVQINRLNIEGCLILNTKGLVDVTYTEELILGSAKYGYITYIGIENAVFEGTKIRIANRTYLPKLYLRNIGGYIDSIEMEVGGEECDCEGYLRMHGNTSDGVSIENGVTWKINGKVYYCIDSNKTSLNRLEYYEICIRGYYKDSNRTGGLTYEVNEEIVKVMEFTGKDGNTVDMHVHTEWGEQLNTEILEHRNRYDIDSTYKLLELTIDCDSFESEGGCRYLVTNEFRNYELREFMNTEVLELNINVGGWYISKDGILHSEVDSMDSEEFIGKLITNSFGICANIENIKVSSRLINVYGSYRIAEYRMRNGKLQLEHFDWKAFE